MNSKDFFINNRNKLFQEVLPNSLVVMFSAEQFPKNGDQYYKFRQNSDTFYFSGINQEETIIVLYKNPQASKFDEYAFIIEPNIDLITWTGHKYSKSEIRNISGIQNVEFNQNFNDIFLKLLKEAKYIYYSHKSNIRGIKYENLTIQACIDIAKNKAQNIDIQDLDPLSMKFRLKKEEYELKNMQEAIDITGETFKEVLNFVNPNVYEYQVEAIINQGFISRGAKDVAYSPIVAAGQNNNILHYCTNRDKCQSGDLLLLDFGAEVEYYAADISRTIPVSGKFTKRQKEVYNAVLKVHTEIMNKMTPGTSINELNKNTEQLIQEELLSLNLISNADIISQDASKPAFKKYYMHGVSHFIGLDVHDVGKKDTILEPGMVLSCEPAIYIKDEGFGIRLENDILVADKPINLSKKIPIEIDEIEDLMNRN